MVRPMTMMMHDNTSHWIVSPLPAPTWMMRREEQRPMLNVVDAFTNEWRGCIS